MRDSIEKIEAIKEEMNQQLFHEAEMFLRLVIDPFCQKWGLSFHSVQGSYYFGTTDGLEIDRCELQRATFVCEDPLLKDPDFVQEIWEIIRVMDHRINTNEIFAEFFGDTPR